MQCRHTAARQHNKKNAVNAACLPACLPAVAQQHAPQCITAVAPEHPRHRTPLTECALRHDRWVRRHKALSSAVRESEAGGVALDVIGNTPINVDFQIVCAKLYVDLRSPPPFFLRRRSVRHASGHVHRSCKETTRPPAVVVVVVLARHVVCGVGCGVRGAGCGG